jgi:hypothetical protein
MLKKLKEKNKTEENIEERICLQIISSAIFAYHTYPSVTVTGRHYFYLILLPQHISIHLEFDEKHLFKNMRDYWGDIVLAQNFNKYLR